MSRPVNVEGSGRKRGSVHSRRGHPEHCQNLVLFRQAYVEAAFGPVRRGSHG